MPIRVRADGAIEVDTVEEALELQARLSKKNGDSQRAATAAYYEESRDAALERDAQAERREGRRWRAIPALPAPPARQRRFRPEPAPERPAPPPAPTPIPPPAVALPAELIREAMAPRSRWDAPPASEPEPVPEQIPDLPVAVVPPPPAPPVSSKRGSPGASAKISEAMKAYWAKRRQARAEALDAAAAAARTPAIEEELDVYEAALAPAPPAAAIEPAPAPPPPPRKPITPKKALAYKLPPGPPPPPAKKPPFCASCFKLGHLQAECPHRPAPRAATEPAAPAAPPAEEDDGPDEVEAFVAELDAFQGRVSAAPAAEPPPVLRLPVIQDAGADLAELGEDDGFDPASVQRPRNRSECRGQPRPCPWVGCDRHLYLNIDRKTGEISEAFPGMEPWHLPVSCVDDIADKGGATLEEIGGILGVTRERIRQIEAKGIKRLKWRASRRKNDFEDEVDRRSNSAEDAVF